MLLEAKNLTRKLADKAILKDLSLELVGGQRLAIAGPSGCGKSLLLRSLALLEPLDGGSVWFDGSEVTASGSATFRSQVIYLRQTPARFEGSVENAMRLPFELGIHRSREFDRQAALAALDRFGRGEQFLDQQHQQISGGEAHLVALLSALQLSPRVLLLDEPTSALDPETAGLVELMLMNWLDEASHSRAYVWVSHSRSQTRRVGSRVLSLSNGRLVYHD